MGNPFEFGTDRNALMINIGGGVITDMGGFVASTYKEVLNSLIYLQLYCLW